MKRSGEKKTNIILALFFVLINSSLFWFVVGKIRADERRLGTDDGSFFANLLIFTASFVFFLIIFLGRRVRLGKRKIVLMLSLFVLSIFWSFLLIYLVDLGLEIGQAYAFHGWVVFSTRLLLGLSIFIAPIHLAYFTAALLMSSKKI